MLLLEAADKSTVIATDEISSAPVELVVLKSIVGGPSSSVMVTDAITSPSWLGINVHWTPNEPSRQVSFHLISTGEVG